MSFKKERDFGLYFITDRWLSKKGIIEDVKAAVRGEVKIVQYREKDSSTKQMIKEAKEIKKICKKNNVLFLIDDRIDIALAVDADGIHLGQEDMPYGYARKLLGKNKIVGLSAHSISGALQNQKLGADYTSIGPVYCTTTKKDAKAPIGLKPIKQLQKKLKISLVAIGGINESNIEDVLKTGAKNIAIISGIVAKGDIEETVRRFIRKINLYK
ncbi:thiamine phosphate synthase [Candidatus Woesearchaeota archaeon]|nr:thiamine phosphate synthase [Candidatus Woesearchaeota archaeon]